MIKEYIKKPDTYRVLKVEWNEEFYKKMIEFTQNNITIQYEDGDMIYKLSKFTDNMGDHKFALLRRSVSQDLNVYIIEYDISKSSYGFISENTLNKLYAEVK